jgi:glycosyltransferase involved in cell wall biosynthesis
MKILFASTLKRKVTQDETASRSQIIYQLAKGLAAKGHEVSLIGTGDSLIPGVTIIPVIEKGWVDLPPVENVWFRDVASMAKMAERIVALQDSFDVIHNHLYPDFFLPLIQARLHKPMLTTIHIQATDYIDELLVEYQKSFFVSISEAHKNGFKKAHINTVVYNGINLNEHPFESEKDDYMLWIGRLGRAKNDDGSYADAKGVRHAIALAQATGQRLLLSGNVESQNFFDQDVKPFLNEKIQWVGKVSAEQPLSKNEVVKLMQKAKVFLMTINWQEPFGLVIAEAMSCGTPVIGFDRGAVRELILDGKTGFIVPPDEGIEGLKKALGKIETINPIDCRSHVEEQFSVERMIENYEKIYSEVSSK